MNTGAMEEKPQKGHKRKQPLPKLETGVVSERANMLPYCFFLPPSDFLLVLSIGVGMEA